MSVKILSVSLIVLLVGGCIGYGIGQVYSPEFINDIIPDNYKARFEELKSQYLKLSSNNSASILEKEDLHEDIEKLQSQLENEWGKFNVLNETYENLLVDYENLHITLANETEEKIALLRALNETQENYDSLLMQYQIITGTGPITPHISTNGTIRRDFAWIFEGQTWTMNLYVPKQLYTYFSNKSRVPTEDYSVYVTHPYDDEYLTTIIEKFNEIASVEGYDVLQKANLVISFVQSLPYSPDNITTGFDEYARYPIETLIQGGGDCEDTSILTSALLESMNYDVVLVNLPNHVAVGVALDTYGIYWLYEGTKYFYVETTGEGWEVGIIPDVHKGQPAQLYPILPVPVCTIDWAGSSLRHKLTLVIDVENVGTGEARGIKVQAAYDGGDGVLWNAVESEFFDLGVGEESVVMLHLDEPRNVHTRILVRIIDPWGYIMDESYSEWFNTD